MQGYPSYTPGAPYYFAGGGGYAGGWYSFPFWESLLIAEALSPGWGWGGGWGGVAVVSTVGTPVATTRASTPAGTTSDRTAAIGVGGGDWGSGGGDWGSGGGDWGGGGGDGGGSWRQRRSCSWRPATGADRSSSSSWIFLGRCSRLRRPG